jgi:CRISPR/Cas system CMR subunit Cmr4 (Cas7 group RAMP superfamily)
MNLASGSLVINKMRLCHNSLNELFLKVTAICFWNLIQITSPIVMDWIQNIINLMKAAYKKGLKVEMIIRANNDQ